MCFTDSFLENKRYDANGHFKLTFKLNQINSLGINSFRLKTNQIFFV
jgi:hypothetical protein